VIRCKIKAKVNTFMWRHFGVDVLGPKPAR
jgi:hypothetical protein